MKKATFGAPVLGLIIGLGLPVSGQDAGAANQKATQNEQANLVKVPAGKKHKIKGVIISRDADGFVLRDLTGGDVQVNLTNATKVEEKKSNPFRRSKDYGTTQLLRGLTVEAEGKGDGSGSLVADKVKMTEDALLVARTVDTRATPIEGRVGDAEGRLTQSEANAQRLSGQLDELAAISNAARGGAKAAQETADLAVAGIDATNKRIDTLLTGLDNYEASKAATINFKVGSVTLLPEAKTALDDIAAQAKNEKAWVIEVTGYASADGSESLNRQLSQKRADAVVRYLAETHAVPLRRIITPFGYGESQPVADNTTRDGRAQNRRVEVKVLVNKALTSPPPAANMNK